MMAVRPGLAFVVDGKGICRTLADLAAAEAARMAEVRARGAVPASCAAIIPEAPARGVSSVHRPVGVVMTENGPRPRHETGAGFHGLIRESPLRVIEYQSARRRRDDAAPLFSPVHHQAATEFAHLYERIAAGQVKCSSLEGGHGSGGDASAMDACIANLQRMRRIEAALARCPGLVGRGAAAQADRGRRAIPARDLVERVCVRGDTFKAVLLAFGWSPQTRHYTPLREALCGALDAIYAL